MVRQPERPGLWRLVKDFLWNQDFRHGLAAVNTIWRYSAGPVARTGSRKWRCQHPNLREARKANGLSMTIFIQCYFWASSHCAFWACLVCPAAEQPLDARNPGDPSPARPEADTEFAEVMKQSTRIWTPR